MAKRPTKTMTVWLSTADLLTEISRVLELRPSRQAVMDKLAHDEAKRLGIETEPPASTTNVH